MKKIWLFLVGLLLLTACADEIPETPTPDKPGPFQGRTLLAYIVSNNLDNYLKANVVDMYKGLSASKDSVALLVFYSPKSGDTSVSLEGPAIFKFVADGKGKINGKEPIPVSSLEIVDKQNCTDAPKVADLVFEQAEAFPSKDLYENATDPKVMERVVKEMIELAPSESYGLAMGSHATGWLEGTPVKGRSFGDDNGYNINIPELATSLKTAFTGQKLDYILFDACMMANAEVAYELKEVTDYIIASVLETPVYGFPYANLLSDLYAESVNYQQICDEFIAFNKVKKLWGTVSVVKCSEMQRLAENVKSNLNLHEEKVNAALPSKVMQYGGPFFRDYSYDLVDIFRQLQGSEPTELKQLMDQVVIAKNCLEGPDYEFGNIVIDKNRYCGLGMYLPNLIPGKSKWDAYYMNSLKWPGAIDWRF